MSTSSSEDELISCCNFIVFAKIKVVCALKLLNLITNYYYQ